MKRRSSDDPVTDLHDYLSGSDIMIAACGHSMNTNWENYRAATLEELARRVADLALSSRSPAPNRPN